MSAATNYFKDQADGCIYALMELDAPTSVLICVCCPQKSAIILPLVNLFQETRFVGLMEPEA